MAKEIQTLLKKGKLTGTKWQADDSKPGGNLLITFSRQGRSGVAYPG
jgi:hypothetical protein